MKNKSFFLIASIAALVSLLSCSKEEAYKPNSGKAPPVQKLKLSYRISEPSTGYDRETPDSLCIYFDGSAAKLEDVGKEPISKIKDEMEVGN